jgi:hypothetical protein
VARDSARLKEWQLTHGSGRNRWITAEDSALDMSYTSNVSKETEHVCGEAGNTGLNVHAQEFSMQKTNFVSAVNLHDVDTQTELMKELICTETQTDISGERKSKEIGIQCTPETQNRGTKYHMVNVNCKASQAIPKMKSQAVLAKCPQVSVATQLDIIGKPSTSDISVMCPQAPGAVSRHTQTFKGLSVDAAVNTVSKQMCL